MAGPQLTTNAIVIRRGPVISGISVIPVILMIRAGAGRSVE